MIDADIFIVGIDAETGKIVENSSSCAMCKRQIINSGIKRVYIRDTDTDYRIVDVQEWIDNDDSLSEEFGY